MFIYGKHVWFAPYPWPLSSNYVTSIIVTFIIKSCNLYHQTMTPLSWNHVTSISPQQPNSLKQQVYLSVSLCPSIKRGIIFCFNFLFVCLDYYFSFAFPVLLVVSPLLRWTIGNLLLIKWHKSLPLCLWISCYFTWSFAF